MKEKFIQVEKEEGPLKADRLVSLLKEECHLNENQATAIIDALGNTNEDNVVSKEDFDALMQKLFV